MATGFRTMAVAVGVVAAVAVAGCGGGGGGPGVASLQGGGSSATSTTVAKLDPQEAALKFAQCMRDHGVQMEDPKVDAEGRVAIAIQGDPGDERAQQAAQKACQHFMDQAAPNGKRGKPDPEEEAKMRDRALKFSQCMRDHGIDFPDPKFDADGGMSISIGEGANVDPDSPAFKNAQDACAKETNMPLPSGGAHVQRGPVGGSVSGGAKK